jgi:hypothetical protein
VSKEPIRVGFVFGPADLVEPWLKLATALGAIPTGDFLLRFLRLELDCFPCVLSSDQCLLKLGVRTKAYILAVVHHTTRLALGDLESGRLRGDSGIRLCFAFRICCGKKAEKKGYINFALIFYIINFRTNNLP